MRHALLLSCLLVASCSDLAQTRADSGGGADQSWGLNRHAQKLDTDRAVSEAINRPGGGDFAKAVALTRASDRPQAVKDHQIGLLVVQGFGQPDAHRSPETLEQGLEMIESSALQAGETRGYAPQHLRLLFQRGAGIAPNAIPIDNVVADCWHGLENGGTGDPQRCVDLRRQRLPHVGK